MEHRRCRSYCRSSTASDWQQRGIVTSATQFFRSIGGAIGIGLLGILFNVLAAPQMQQLRAMGVSPASIMDRQKRAELPPEAQPIIFQMIGSGLTWVFLAMAIVAVAQVGVSFLMASDEEHPATTAETNQLEAHCDVKLARFAGGSEVNTTSAPTSAPGAPSYAVNLMAVLAANSS